MSPDPSILPAGLAGPRRPQAALKAVIFFCLAALAVLAHALLVAHTGAAGLIWLAGLTVLAMFVSIEFAFALMLVMVFLQNGFTSLVVPALREYSHFRILLGGSLLNLVLTSAIAFLAWLKWRRLMPGESRDLPLWVTLFVATILAYTAYGALASGAGAVIYARVYLTGVLMLIVGVVMGLRLSLGYAAGLVRLIALVLVAWGVGEFMFTHDFYDLFHVMDYLNLKATQLDNDQNFGSISEVIAQYTTSYLNLSGRFGLDLDILRPKGPNIHNISYAYALCFCCLVCFMRRAHAVALACFLMALLVGAKGPLILIVGTTGLCLFYEWSRNPALLRLALAGLMASYLVAGLIYGFVTKDYHVLGLMGGLRGFLENPVGHGVGVGGNLSPAGMNEADFAWYQSLGFADFALESALGVMLYQIGVGTAVFLLFYGKLWKNVWTATQYFAYDRRLVVVPVALGLLLVNSVFQEEALSPLGWGPWLLLGGLLLGRHGWREHDKTKDNPAAPRT